MEGSTFEIFAKIHLQKSPEGVLWKFVYMDVSAWPIFCPHLAPISIPILFKTLPNFVQIECIFMINWLEYNYTPKLCKLAAFIAMKNPDRHTKFFEKAPQICKRQACYIHVYHADENPSVVRPT